MKYTFEYSPLPTLEKYKVLAPMLPITFIHGEIEFSTLALVDSGAETAIMSTVYADELGMAWDKLPKKSGYTLSGNFLYHTYKDIEVEICNERVFIPINIVEGISPFKCILGRKDLFKKAKITFEGYKNVFHIEMKKMN